MDLMWSLIAWNLNWRLKSNIIVVERSDQFSYHSHYHAKTFKFQVNVIEYKIHLQIHLRQAQVAEWESAHIIYAQVFTISEIIWSIWGKKFPWNSHGHWNMQIMMAKVLWNNL